MKDLIVKVEEWAKEKGILEKATPASQFEKHMEEVGELGRALIENDREKIIDAIGDVCVTTIILSYLVQGKSVLDYGGHSHQWSRYEPIDMDVEIGRVSLYDCLLSDCADIQHDLVTKNQPLLMNLSAYSVFTCLYSIADEHDLELRDCLQSAYNVIAKRTGKMVNGVFVKDEE